MSSEYYLPPKINAPLKRLQAAYADSEQSLLAEILNSARILVIEGTEYDNWNGGTHGHEVKLFLPQFKIRKAFLNESGTTLHCSPRMLPTSISVQYGLNPIMKRTLSIRKLRHYIKGLRSIQTRYRSGNPVISDYS